MPRNGLFSTQYPRVLVYGFAWSVSSVIQDCVENLMMVLSSLPDYLPQRAQRTLR